MNIFDTDRSGSINFMEFEGLYRYIQVSQPATNEVMHANLCRTGMGSLSDSTRTTRV